MSSRMASQAAGAAAIRGPTSSQALALPVDHRLLHIDDLDCPHARVVQRGPGRIAESEPADQHPERLAAGPCQAERRQLRLADREQARHQMFVAQQHLEHIRIYGGDPAPTQDDRPHRGRPVVQFLD